jgi:acyl-CoA synthetase (AMP-forming)/AMP-acid ligase II
MSVKNINLYSNPLWQKIVAKSLEQSTKPILLDDQGAKITYGDFISRVDAYAAELVARGVAKGDRVLFLEKPSLRGIVLFFALYRAGAVVVIADPAMGQANFTSRVTFAGVSSIVSDPKLYFVNRVPGLVTLLRRLQYEVPDICSIKTPVLVLPRQPRPLSQMPIEVVINATEDALIIFTSGTTSVPKGVVHTFASLAATLDYIKSELPTEPHDMFYSSQLHFALIALLSGTKAMVTEVLTFSPKHFFAVCAAYAPTHVFLLPAEGAELMTYCQKNQLHFPATIKQLLFGSAPVLKGFLERLQPFLAPATEVLAIYGSTEILPATVTTLKEKLSFEGAGDYLGTPLPGVTARIVNDEIIVSGPNLCHRYLDDGEVRTEFQSGDLGYLTKTCAVVLTGRRKDMIIKGNHNIYPALFESTISRIPGVGGCALVGLFNETIQDEQIVLCIENNSLESDTALCKRVNGLIRSGEYSIDTYALPDKIICLSLPLGGRSRKINKTLLRTSVAKLL